MARTPINDGDGGLAVRNALNAMFTEIYGFGIADIAGLVAALATKADLSSPTLTGTPTAPTAPDATNNTQLATTAFVQTLIASVINSAPGALDTLDELAAAFGDDPNFAATMATALAGKQPIDATLTALAGLAGGPNKIAYFTGTDVLAQADLTAFGRTLIAVANATAAKVALEIALADLTDGTEAVQDIVGALIVAAGGSYNDTAGSIGLPATADPWLWLKLGADSVVGTTAFANVSGMVFSADANSTYTVRVIGAYQAAATTTGIALALDIPAGAEIIGFNQVMTSATAMAGTEQIADATTTGATTGVRAAATNTPIIYEAIVRINATAGNVQLTQRSEIAASNTTLKANITAMGYRKI